MGARMARLVRNVNVENRAHREMDKIKAAPRHPGTRTTAPDVHIDEIHTRDNELLTRLQQVYVESKDPPPLDSAAGLKRVEQSAAHRPARSSLPGAGVGIYNLSEIPRGKLSLVEALTALNKHKLAPQTWTPEKISHELELDLDDARALTHFFIPFEVKITPPKSESKKQIRDS